MSRVVGPGDCQMPGIGNGSGWISFRDLMLMVGTLPAKLGTENTWSKNFRPHGIQILISSSGSLGDGNLKW